MLGQRMLMAATRVAIPFPDGIANLLLRFRADLGIAKDGSDFISQWDDQKTGRNWLQGTQTNKPLWVDNQINGNPIVRFDGVDNYMQESGGTVFQPFHWWLVIKQISWTNGRYIFHGATSGSAELKQQGTTPIIQQYAGLGNSNQISATIGTYFLINSFFSGNTSYQGLNDDAEVSIDNPGTQNLADGTTVASQWNGLNFANFELAEVLLYTAEKAGSDKTSLKDYFNSQYNLW